MQRTTALSTKKLGRMLCALLASAVLSGCEDPAEADLDRCIAYQRIGDWSNAIQACDQATQKSLTSDAGRLALGKLGLLREKAAALAAWNKEQAAAKQRELARADERQKKAAAAEGSRSTPIQEAAPQSPAAVSQTMKRVASEARQVLNRCYPPRVRELSRVCIEDLRESHAALKRLRDQIEDTRGAAGWEDLGLALILGQDCCNCAPDDVRYCQKVETSLKDAERKIGR